MNSEEKLIKDINEYERLEDKLKTLNNKSTTKKGIVLLIANIIIMVLALNPTNINLILMIIVACNLWICFDLIANAPYTKYFDSMRDIVFKQRISMCSLILVSIIAIIKFLSGDLNTIIAVINYIIAIDVFSSVYAIYRGLENDYVLTKDTEDAKEKALEKIYETEYFKDMAKDLSESINNTQISVVDHNVDHIWLSRPMTIDCDIVYSIRELDDESKPIDLIVNNLAQINDLHEQIEKTAESLNGVNLRYSHNNAYVFVYDNIERFDEYGNHKDEPLRFKLDELNKINKENLSNVDLWAIAMRY